MIHSASTQQMIMVELTVPYENRMEEAHIYKLSICGNNRTKALKLLAEIAETAPDGSGAGEMRGSFIRIKKALTIAGPVGQVV